MCDCSGPAVASQVAPLRVNPPMPENKTVEQNHGDKAGENRNLYSNDQNLLHDWTLNSRRARGCQVQLHSRPLFNDASGGRNHPLNLKCIENQEPRAPR